MLYQESGHRTQVVTASSEAVRHGIGSGMALVEAQALLQSAVFLPHDADADRLALQTLASVCYRFSPQVGLEPTENTPTTHSLVLDITGCTHLFGGDSGLARQLVIELAELGYFAHVATANTIGAAWAIARYGHGAGSARRLKSLPVEALRIPEKLTTRLREFDLRTIGQLLALPQETLPSRFGKVLTERLDQMFGRRAELLIPLPRPEPVFAQWASDDPIGHPAAIRHVCADLLTEVLDTLKSRGEGLLRLTLTLDSESTAPATLDIGLAKPAESATHLLNLIQLKLEVTAVPEWLNAIRMEASVTAPLQTQQRNLFGLQESTDNGSVRRLVDRLTARLGRDSVVRPNLLPEAVPEQAVEFTPLAEIVSEARSAPAPAIASARPLILLPQPELIRVTFTAGDGTLESIRWNGCCYPVAHHTEPERIATAWWQETGSVRRDYCQVETQAGARFWIFRDGNGNWFLHGLFE
ncbi:MAG: DNA polymerase Y family protein [Planctomycetota bacterium]|nr:DNA polymerase Y family protein [Planctomycetota bacterium]